MKRLEDLSSHELSYLAGIFEFAHWNISAFKKRSHVGFHYDIRLARSSNPEIVKWLGQLFEIDMISARGKQVVKEVKFHNRIRCINMHYQPINIKLSSKAIQKLIPLIKPYLIFKKEHCLIFEQFIKTIQVHSSGPTYILPVEILQKRYFLADKLNVLNKSVYAEKKKMLNKQEGVKE